MIDRRVLIHFDYILFLSLLPFMGVSLFLIYEINLYLFKKELVYIFIGLFVFFTLLILPLRKFLWLIPYLYFFNLFLLLLTDFFGISILGARRWLYIPFLHITIQPSEFMKTSFLLMLGYMIFKNPPSKEGYSLKEFLKISFFIILPFLLIAKEPDLGTALILFLTGFGILFIIGVNKKIWIFLTIFSIFFVPFSYKYLLKDYQKQRIVSLFSKEPSYHVKNSLIAIGSGGVFGKSKENATQTQLKFLPIASSDFIFAYYVERFGFIGAVALIFGYIVLIYRLFSLSYKMKQDWFLRVMLIGVGLIIFIYSFVNIAMTINMGPVVGVPLPLLSHGGTSFINFMILFGILENLLAKRFEFIYNFTERSNTGL